MGRSIADLRISTKHALPTKFLPVPTILDIPGVRERISRLSVAEYHRLDEYNENGRRTELIRGIVIEKMSKSPLHRNVCSRLFKLLLASVPAGFTVWKEEPLTLADSEPEPDISVTAGDEKAFEHEHPGTAHLVVEVAVSSAALDRENASLYAEAMVREYWIVLGELQKVEVYRRPQSGRYQETSVYNVDDVITLSSIPNLHVPVEKIFGESVKRVISR
jgi:Uma2 family endonuclease